MHHIGIIVIVFPQCDARVCTGIGEHDFVELESSHSEDATPEESMTVDGELLKTAHSLWRITYTEDRLHVWVFEDKRILESLPQSAVVPAIPQKQQMMIANCSGTQLEQFLHENGGRMTKKAEDFTRHE